jgi:hypothetical protein
MDKALKLKVELIVLKLQQMINNQMPESILTTDGKISGHWSETKEKMEDSNWTKLNPIEVTILSLSRNFGPTPLLNYEERMELFSTIWPVGNNNGNDWLGWVELMEVILRKLPLNSIKITVDDVMEIIEAKVSFIKKVVDREPYHHGYDPQADDDGARHYEVNGLGLDEDNRFDYEKDDCWFDLKTNESLTFEEVKKRFL